MADALTNIETAIRARLEDQISSVKIRAFEDMPLDERDVPCIVVDLGNENFSELSDDAPGDRLDESAVQVDLLIVENRSRKGFREAARSLRNDVMKALADFGTLGLDGLTDLRRQASNPQQFVSEKGSQGGYHLAYRARFTTSESNPGVMCRTR